MTSDHPLRCCTAAGVVLLQLALLVALPRADAVLDGDVHHGRAHVAAPGDAPCSPGHDHNACQICRGLGTHALTAAGVASRAAGYEATRHVPPAAWLADSQRTTEANRSRAPPVA